MKKVYYWVCFVWFWLFISLVPALAFEENINHGLFRLGTDQVGELKLLNPYWNEDLDRLTANSRRKVVIKSRKELFEILSGLGNEVIPGERLEVNKEDYPLVFQQIHDRIGDRWEIQAEDGSHFKGKVSGFILYRSKIDRGIFRGLKLFLVITPGKEFSSGHPATRQSFYNLIGFRHRYPKPRISDFVLIQKTPKPGSLDPFWIKEEIYNKLKIKDRYTTMKYHFWDDSNQSDQEYYLSFTMREFADPESHRGLYRVSIDKSPKKIVLGKPIVPSSFSIHDGCLDLYPESRFSLKIENRKKQFYVLTCDCFIGEYSVIVEKTAKGSRVVCYSENIDAWKRNW